MEESCTHYKKNISRLMEKLIQDNLFSISYNEYMRTITTGFPIIPPELTGKNKSLTDRKQPAFPFNLQAKDRGRTVFSDPAFMENRSRRF